MTPRPYQIKGSSFLAARRHALLADEMRVGKTPQAIMAADDVNAKRVLVLCPAIATYQWREEWVQWSNRAPAEIITDTAPSSSFEGVAIVSYNRAAQQHLPALTALPAWDLVIVDEAHFAKNPEAARTKAVYGRGGLGWNSKRLWALTGTPAPNHAGELWPLLRAFGTVKMTYEEFVSYYCYYDRRAGRVFGNKRQHLTELRALLDPIVLRRTRVQVAPDMPKIGYSFFAVEPKPGVDLPSEDPAQIDTEDRIAVAMAKVPPLAAEILGNIAGGEYRQTVVFGFHLDPLRNLGELLTECGLDVSVIRGDTPPERRQNILAAFAAGVCQVVLVQIMTAGTAIDLSAAQHGYFLELDWSPGNNEQAASRLVNLQTQLPVTMDIVNWPGTHDDHVQRTLLRKVANAVFTA
jgi:SWI/SNF-related matrix-associated actin-dependent regulator 1 of chromatin subfamily A